MSCWWRRAGQKPPTTWLWRILQPQTATLQPPFAWTASTRMRMTAGHMPPPLVSYLPLAALLALTSFSITAPGWFPPGHHFSSSNPLVSAYCCLPQTCTQVIWPLTHFSLRTARNLKCNPCQQHGGQNTFQSRLTVPVIRADHWSFKILSHWPPWTICCHQKQLQ